MNLEQRKRKFSQLLQNLLKSHNGVKSKLAQELNISPTRLANWFQGKVDPAGLDIISFKQISQVTGYSVEELAKILGFIEEDPSEARFRKLIAELLSDQTQAELAQKLGVDQTTISKWLSLDKNIDFKKITAKVIISISREKNWSVDKLFNYLKLESTIDTDNKKLQTTYTKAKPSDVLNPQTILIIIEQEDNTIASNYFSNLVEYLKFQAKNIKIATIPKLPQSLADIDILIFDINTADSPSIQLIKDLTFNGDIIIFADAIALPLIRDKISSVVSEIFAKPVDWSALQSFPYFQSR